MTYEDKTTCFQQAPSAEEFRISLYDDWGDSYTTLYFLYPAIIAFYSLLLHFIKWKTVFSQCRSISVRSSLFWILTMFPIMLFGHMLSLFIPSMLPYFEFVQTIWLGYALHRGYNLFRGLAGGTRLFIECTDDFKARGNQPPFCCLWKLCPIISNSARTTKMIRFCIYQFCICTFILMSDLYEIFCDIKKILNFFEKFLRAQKYFYTPDFTHHHSRPSSRPLPLHQ